MKILAAALALLTLPACAQTWVKVAVESTGAVTLPAGTTYRYGIGSGTTIAGADCAKVSCWTTKTLTANTTYSSLYWPSGALGFDDPAPGIAKELDILETTSAQSITIANQAVTVPALPVPAPTILSSWSLTGCALDIYSDGTAKIRTGCVVVRQ